MNCSNWATNSLTAFSSICIVQLSDAGWSSMVARRAHNPKVVGSNPAPATKFSNPRFCRGFFLALWFESLSSKGRLKTGFSGFQTTFVFVLIIIVGRTHATALVLPIAFVAWAMPTNCQTFQTTFPTHSRIGNIGLHFCPLCSTCRLKRVPAAW